MDLDPLRIAIRALAAFIFLLALLRLSGKRAISQGTAFDFVLSLVLGDLVDNVIWGEAPFGQFAVAAMTLVGARLLVTMHKGRADA
jgi:uncharacterized membrane protein YcaP (DUF421 family)